MGCEYVELCAFNDKGFIDNAFIVLLEVIDKVRQRELDEIKTWF